MQLIVISKGETAIITILASLAGEIWQWFRSHTVLEDNTVQFPAPKSGCSQTSMIPSLGEPSASSLLAKQQILS